MNKYLVIYQDLPHDKVKKHEVLPFPMMGHHLLVKPCDVPGKYGYPAIYIRHYKAQVGNKEFLIVAYTEAEQTRDFQLKLVSDSARLMIKQKVVTRAELESMDFN